MANTIIDKLDKIYETKLQIKSAIGTDSDVFEDYPGYIRSMSGAGVSYAYLDERLSYYVETSELESMGYITDSALSGYATQSYVVDYVATYGGNVDLSAYVTKVELNNASYITSDIKELTGPLYITYQETNNTLYGLKSYSHIVAGDENKTVPAFIASKRYCTNGVGSYVNMTSFFVNSDGRAKFAHKASAGGGGDDSFMCFNAYGFKVAYSGAAGTAATTEYEVIHEGNIENYITSIDENIIPKETDTYSLGSSSYYYNTVFTNRLQGNSSVNIRTNNNNRVSFTNTAFRPMLANYDLGSTDYPWKNTYTTYINSYAVTDFATKSSVNAMFSYDSATGTLTITTLS